MLNKFKKALYIVLPIIFWLIVWEIAALLVNRSYFLPTVEKTFSALFNILSSITFYKVVLFTILRVIAGLTIGILFAILFAALACKFKAARAIISPMISVMKSTPVATLIILLWLFVSGNDLPILISVLMVMPIVWQNLVDGYETIDKNLVEVCAVFEFSFLKRLKYLIFPSLLKYFIPSLITAVGLAWKSEIAAEIIAYTKNSIGQYINDANYMYDSASVFAWTLVIIVLSISLEFLTKRLLRRFKV